AIGGNAAGWRHHDEIFSGPDLSYRDVELLTRVLQWRDDDAAATAEDAALEGRPCRKVTLVPTGRTEFPFARYVLWLGRDDLLLAREELDVAVREIGAREDLVVVAPARRVATDATGPARARKAHPVFVGGERRR